MAKPGKTCSKLPVNQ